MPSSTVLIFVLGSTTLMLLRVKHIIVKYLQYQQQTPHTSPSPAPRDSGSFCLRVLSVGLIFPLVSISLCACLCSLFLLITSLPSAWKLLRRPRTVTMVNRWLGLNTRLQRRRLNLHFCASPNFLISIQHPCYPAPALGSKSLLKISRAEQMMFSTRHPHTADSMQKRQAPYPAAREP